MRRTSVVSLSAVLVLTAALLVGGGAAVVAQTTAPDYTGHPLIGSWMLDTDTTDPGNLHSLVIFSAEGSYLEVGPDGPGVGAWEPTGDTTAILTIVFVEDEGTGMVRASIQVAADGQTLTASYTLEFVDPATGEGTGQVGPGGVEGVRIVAEAPGTPVTSFEDFYSEEGTPAATPAA